MLAPVAPPRMRRHAGACRRPGQTHAQDAAWVCDRVSGTSSACPAAPPLAPPAAETPFSPMRGLAALARRAGAARQLMVVRGGGGGPLGKPLPPSQALMEEDEL